MKIPEKVAVRCLGLSRRYGKVEALRSLSLYVAHGSVFGFLGRNGAGKTTTIRLLTGLARPTAGEGWVAGVRTTDGNHAGRRRFGYLPEEPAFYGWMTPLEFLDYVGRLNEIEAARRQRRIAELLDQVGLTEARSRRIGGFSRGMRQRLGVAQALIHRPPVLFLDEPTSALDPAGRRDVLALIDRLRGQTTVFLSSHILADVEKVCDTVGVLHEGSLVTVAGRDELMSQYNLDVVELELLAGHRMPEELVGSLAAKPWIRDVTAGAQVTRITIEDVDRGRSALLPMLAAHDLPFNRIEWVRPTLEEVFLDISAQASLN